MFLDLLQKRRSTRRYKDIPVEDEKVDAILKAALLSPSSRSIRPWEFVVIKNKETIEKLSKAKTHGSSFIKEAPLLITVIADTNKSDVTVEDASIAALIIQLATEDLGLGSCWIQIRNRENNNGSAETYVKEVLGIPENYMVECIISIGYKNQNLPEYKDEEIQYEKIHEERFLQW